MKKARWVELAGEITRRTLIFPPVSQSLMLHQDGLSLTELGKGEKREQNWLSLYL